MEHRRAGAKAAGHNLLADMPMAMKRAIVYDAGSRDPVLAIAERSGQGFGPVRIRGRRRVADQLCNCEWVTLGT